MDGFSIGDSEITVGLWNVVVAYAVENKGYDLKEIDEADFSADFPGLDLEYGLGLPAIGMTWYDAVKWCNAFSEMMGYEPAYHTDETLTDVFRTGEIDTTASTVNWEANGYRLPTVPEWEYAARYTPTGELTPNTSFSGYADGAVAGDFAWSSDNSGGTPHRVALKNPSAIGVYDMSGNVDEWAWTEAAPTIGENNHAVNPRALESQRPAGGFSFLNPAASIVTSIEGFELHHPQFGYRFIGFRAVKY